MNPGAIIVLLLLFGLVVASDKIEFIKKGTQKYKKIKEIYITIVGLVLLVILSLIVIQNWDQIDWFSGRGGNPQESYQDPY